MAELRVERPRERHAKIMRRLIIGIDIGGTKVAGGLVTPQGRLVKSLILPTHAERGYAASLAQILTLIQQLHDAAGGPEALEGIGLLAPGPLNPHTGLVINPPNLPGWKNVKLAEKVERRFHVKAKVENDANAAGLAEVLFGAAVGHRHVFYVTVSTGIGTGIIINRKIYHGKNGVAGEGGHVCVDYHSPYRCGCGSFGCIEALAAGPAMVRRAQVHLLQDHTQPSLLRDLTHGQLNRLTPQLIAQAAESGDAVAKFIVEQTGFFLGVWLGGMIALFDPDAIVIGGGVAQIGKPLFQAIRNTIPYHSINPNLARRVPLLRAKLNKNVGIYGAAALFLRAGVEAENF